MQFKSQIDLVEATMNKFKTPVLQRKDTLNPHSAAFRQDSS